MRLDIDFRLIEITLELNILEYQYELIKKQIEQLKNIEYLKFKEYLKKEKISPNEPEWDCEKQEFNNKIDITIPRIFWNSYIVSLYAVFETSVIEIANLLQNKLNKDEPINNIKGDFIQRAKKYFKDIKYFQLFTNENELFQARTLATVRHAIAHSNGRNDMLKNKIKDNIKAIEKQKIGISTYYNYLVIEPKYAKKTYLTIKSILENLVNQYKLWDNKNGYNESTSHPDRPVIGTSACN